MNSILKLIFKDEVQDIFDHFSAVFDIKILFYTVDGEIVKVGLNKPNSSYCDLIQAKLYGRKSCLEMDNKRRIEAKARGDTICYRCHAGLDESITPLYSNDQLLGYVGFGQFRTAPGISSQVLRDWSKKYPAAELQKAYDQLPFYSPEKVQHILGLFSVLVKYIVSQRMITIKGDLLAQQMLSYIDRHIDQSVTLQEVARHFGRSESTVSHLFRKKFNSGFKQTLIDLKLAKADEYLKTFPNLKISEIAEKIGYDDPLYFSRLYKKNRKLTPRQYQEKFLKV